MQFKQPSLELRSWMIHKGSNAAYTWWKVITCYQISKVIRQFYKDNITTYNTMIEIMISSILQLNNDVKVKAIRCMVTCIAFW